MSKQAERRMPTIVIYPTEELRRQIQELAKREHRSLSNQCVHILSRHVERQDSAAQ